MHRADDLKHLVSTSEYFIRNSRLGHDTALAGMPYLTQGLRFTGTENVINLLWADSPADKAGLKLGTGFGASEKFHINRKVRTLSKRHSPLPLFCMSFPRRIGMRPSPPKTTAPPNFSARN